jgi:nitrite reductase (cytochrome c-552)
MVARDSASPRVREARRAQRYAQFLVDFVEAENSMGFHAPQEAARLLGHAIDAARKGQNALHGVAGAAPVVMPGAAAAASRPRGSGR